jgi:hypothetical protein
MHGCGVGSEHDVWVEHREKRVEVTVARRGEEACVPRNSGRLEVVI